MLNSHRQTANTATVVTVIFVDVLQSETVVLVPKPQPLPKHWQRSELKTSVVFLGALMQAAQSSFPPARGQVPAILQQALKLVHLFTFPPPPNISSFSSLLQ